MSKITINTQSIKNQLKNFTDRPANALLEYLWNGFDAQANNVHLNYKYSVDANGMSFGYPDLEIWDDGLGWNVNNIHTADLFLVSTKKHQAFKTLPQGKDGVGRFTFYSFANRAIWQTVFQGQKFKLTLEADSLDDYKLEKNESAITITNGTKVNFSVNSDKLTQTFFEKELIEVIKLEFCWFLKLYKEKNIYINGKKITIKDLIRKEQNFDLIIGENKFNLNLVQWKAKPTRESSKYYFLTSSGEENFKRTTGLNYKSDDFYHSAYIQSDFFDSYKYWGDDEASGGQKSLIESPDDKIKKITYDKLVNKVSEALENIRKPFLSEVSDTKIEEWKKDEVLPTVTSLGLKQEEYEEIVKELYVTVPQLFTNSNDEQRKIILNLLSYLLSTEERDLILKLLSQVYDLTEEEKKSLSELLDRTTLSNIVKTIKEIDYRLNVLNSLDEILLTDKNIKTKEVSHLQKILDENFWVFGEGYRLFASTEGAMRKTLIKFRDEILRSNEDIITNSKKELDIFLTKSETTSDKISCIVVEIKRPTINLGKAELDQIKEYMDTILNEKACNGGKTDWVFYLIGTQYNDYIKKEINNAKSWGEEKNGLVFRDDTHNAKLYVKKWSDILYVEQKSKYIYLQEKLNIKLKNINKDSVEEVVDSVSSKKNKVKVPVKS